MILYAGNGRSSHALWVEFGSYDRWSLARREGAVPTVRRGKSSYRRVGDGIEATFSPCFCFIGLLQTVNTASRMESTGERDKIQVSQKTTDLIRLAGKG
jgi:Adenylate and Guanylate cyclase catalytic domain